MANFGLLNKPRKAHVVLKIYQKSLDYDYKSKLSLLIENTFLNKPQKIAVFEFRRASEKTKVKIVSAIAAQIKLDIKNF